jgi:very-short-patch-repair endonuclease
MGRKGVGHCRVCGTEYSYNRGDGRNVCHACECSTQSHCACGCGGIVMNPDSRGRYRKFIYGHNNKNGNHPRIGVTQPEAEVIKRTKAMLKHFRTKVPTCIELELYGFLDSVGVEYEPQKQIGRTVVDAFVPNLNLVVYADGRYWHDKPEIRERDLRNDGRVLRRGYNLLRLSSVDNGYHLDLTPLKLLVG